MSTYKETGYVKPLTTEERGLSYADDAWVRTVTECCEAGVEIFDNDTVSRLLVLLDRARPSDRMMMSGPGATPITAEELADLAAWARAAAGEPDDERECLHCGKTMAAPDCDMEASSLCHNCAHRGAAELGSAVARLLATVGQLTARGDALASRLEESVAIIDGLLADNDALCGRAAHVGCVITCAHYADPKTPCQRCTRDGCAPCELCEWCQPKGDER